MAVIEVNPSSGGAAGSSAQRQATSGSSAQHGAPLDLQHLQCGVNVICGDPPLAGRGKLVEGALGLLEKAFARLRAALTVSKGAARATELLRPGGRLIGEAGSSSRIRILQGNPRQAEAFFNQLVRETGATRLSKEGLAGFAKLPGEGGTIGLRSVSTSGPPTIDVRIPGLGIREIKFIP